MVSVFDVASEFVDRSGGAIEAVKLQKLCFYAFGWYAHLTGEPLFPETIYAMEKGPVVGELLSAHAGQRRVDEPMMQGQRSEREEVRAPMEPYRWAVLDAVWSTYGGLSSWELVEMTHRETVWESAWAARRPGGKRGDLPHAAIVEYFMARLPRPDEKLDLPPAMISRAPAEELARIESQARVHHPFVDAVKSFPHAS